MSDSRFYLKATFEVYGKVFSCDTSLNWSGADEECDERIASWFVDCYNKAYAEFQWNQSEIKAEMQNKAEELAEREQLAKLLKKYQND
jgi:hypothetical protein